MGTPRILINAIGIAQTGGSRSYIRNVLQELAQDDRGFRFSILAFPGQLDGYDTGRVEVEHVRLPSHIPGSHSAIWRVLYEESLLPRRARDYDLLYCQGDLSPAWGSTPQVVLLRNLNIYDRRWYPGIRTSTLARLVQYGVRHARRVLFPTRAAADLVGTSLDLPRDRVRVVSYGISLDAFRDVAPEPADTRYLFLAASPERHKNIEVLIDCLPHLTDPNIEVWIAGVSYLDPGHRGVLEQRARERGVAERVRFLGQVPYEELLGYYRGAAAFVFPSLLESFGHPLLEAMATGAPVIASDIATFRENAGDAALYFAPTDAAALAEAVDRVLGESDETRERVARGHARAAQLSWKASVDGLCRVFDEVLSGAG